MKKFYLGTALTNAAIASNSIVQLIGYGFSCTFNWSGITEDFAGLPEIEIDAIRRADFCVFLLPGKRGTHIEIGAALALDKPTFLLKLPSYVEADIPFYRLATMVNSLDEIRDFIMIR